MDTGDININIPENISQALQRRADFIGISRKELLDSSMYIAVETNENDAEIKEMALRLKKESENGN